MKNRLAYLWPFLRGHRNKLIYGQLSILASAVVGLASPLLVGKAIDALRADISRATLISYAALVVAVSLVQGVFSYLQRLILVGMSRDVELDLRDAYFAHLETQPPSFFQDRPTGDLMARATNDLQAVRMLCGPAIMYSSNTLFTAAGALFFMARMNGRLTLLALVTMPLVAFTTKFFGERIHAMFTAVQARFSDISARVQESFAGVRVVRAYAQEEREMEQLRRLNEDYLEQNKRLIGWTVAFYPLLQGLVGLGFVAVLWYGGILVIRGSLTVGEFVTFNFFLSKLIWPMIAIGWVINLAQRGLASLTRMREVLDVEPAIHDEEPLAEWPAEGLQGAVRFQDLTFSYKAGAPPVLSGITLNVPAGHTVAVVGRTGSGKSTLLALIPRLLDPPEQALWIDGGDIRHLPLARLRSAIGMVPQETFLFSATIRENIALGRPEATLEQVLEAARLASLESDLAHFPQGLDTMVGERGLTLSGGQKQRVALARALLREPRILLLDDCLSAVDTHTEETILENLRTVFEGRTVFVVSHRISTVKDADLILVLDQGHILERGTHAQLTAAGGIYADLHQRQLLEEELRGRVGEYFLDSAGQGVRSDIMRVVITGGSGLIGSALARELGGAGHDAVVLTRDPEKAGTLAAGRPSGVRAVQWDGKTPAGWGPLLDGDTVIVHLAGESIASGRWTEDKKRRIRDSRVGSGKAILQAIRESAAKPRALLQGSAVGYYGPHGDEVIQESAAPGNDFLAGVCKEWEASTAEVEALGVRRAILRTGVVLARDGGALPKMTLPFKMMAGGHLGTGRQWLPWIHLADEVGAIRFLAEHADARGPFNLTAPNPVTNRELTRILAGALHRPGFIPAPGFALRLALGEMADMLLNGQRVVPSRLLELGFRFQYPDAEPALRGLLD